MLTVVTGAAGFVGQAVVSHMRDQGYPGVVRLLDRAPIAPSGPFERHVVDLLRTGVTHQRAVHGRQSRPVHIVWRVHLTLVAAYEHQHVARAGIRDRHAGVGQAADRRRDSRHDLERDALLVQEQRFLSAAVEDERVAPLQARDGLAFARLLGE